MNILCSLNKTFQHFINTVVRLMIIVVKFVPNLKIHIETTYFIYRDRKSI